MADRASTMPRTEYILGHSGREIRRLMLQAGILRPIIERFLRGAGIGRGMPQCQIVGPAQYCAWTRV